MKIRPIVKKAYSRVKILPTFDMGEPDVSIILAGMGRSGTTWAGDIINHDDSYRVLFEPFLPKKVNEARGFEYLQYLAPDANSAHLESKAKAILAGKVKNSWVDRDNRRIFYRQRMLKDIRCNLMLGWLKRVANGPPVVLLIRHPLQLVLSWKKLGWGKEVLGNRGDMAIILSQNALVSDFPVISDVMKGIDTNDMLEMILVQWCIFHLVPSIHLEHNEGHVVYYENLLTDFDGEVSKLFSYLDKPFDGDTLGSRAGRESSTNFNGRKFDKDMSSLLNGWADEFSAKQIRRCGYILEAFGLNNMYDFYGRPTGAQLDGLST